MPTKFEKDPNTFYLQKPTAQADYKCIVAQTDIKIHSTHTQK